MQPTHRDFLTNLQQKITFLVAINIRTQCAQHTQQRFRELNVKKLELEMMNTSVILLIVLCLVVCAQEAHSLPAPIGQGTMLKLPKWLNPPTAKEITSCFSANDLGTKGIPCLEEGLEQITKGILTPGPACCSFAAALVDGCLSNFPPLILDLFYPPFIKAQCSQYLSPH